MRIRSFSFNSGLEINPLSKLWATRNNSAFLLIWLLCSVITPEVLAQQLNISNHRQVFIDSRFLTDPKGVELVVHQPQKTGDFTIKPEHPWESGGIGPYSAVLKYDDTYHMWYHAMSTTQWDTGNESGSICYAKSRDGIHWEKPILGVVEFDGELTNNIVLGQGAAGVKLGQDGGMVFIDPYSARGDQFKLAVRTGRTGKDFHIFSSPDGIHWKLTHPSLMGADTKYRLDCQNVIYWDEQTRKYVIYGRTTTFGGRSIFRGEADKLEEFVKLKNMPVVIAPDSLDLKHGQRHVVDYYMSAAIKYPWADNAYYMFPTAYYHYIPKTLAEFREEVPTNAGPLDTQFAASTDGISWQRYDRRPFVPLGMKGEFDWASARVFYGMVPSLNGNEIYIYYRASDWLHGWDRDERNKKLLTDAGLGASQNIAVISRVVIRMDGFVSVRGSYTGGEFTTPPVVFKGSRLLLNVNTSATGIVRVEIQDKNGKAIDGYSMEECSRIHTSNEINRVVSWSGGSDISTLEGKPVRLHFEIRDADLYAFQFKD